MKYMIIFEQLYFWYSVPCVHIERAVEVTAVFLAIFSDPYLGMLRAS